VDLVAAIVSQYTGKKVDGGNREGSGYQNSPAGAALNLAWLLDRDWLLWRLILSFCRYECVQ
jgi:hypothetical protein